MAKLPDPTASLSSQGQKLYQQLVAKRRRIDGMYRSLLNHPELTRRVSDLGTFLRFGAGALPGVAGCLVVGSHEGPPRFAAAHIMAHLIREGR